MRQRRPGIPKEVAVAILLLICLATETAAQKNQNYEPLTARVPDRLTRQDVETLLARRRDLSNVDINKKYAQIRRMYEPYIAGGKPAAPGAWPWAAAIAIATVDGPPLPFCGGTLIADAWILTAAHCKVRRNDYILLGRTDLKADTGEIRFAAADQIAHPAADIALVKLNEASTFSTVPLNTDESVGTVSNPEATVIGWGQSVAGGSASPRLQEVALPIISLEECKQLYAGTPVTISDALLCAGRLGSPTDACRGDSGGPLLVHGSNGTGWRQAGVVGAGSKNCDENVTHAGIYVRVAGFTGWIQKTTTGQR